MIVIHQPGTNSKALIKLLDDALGHGHKAENIYFKNPGMLQQYKEMEKPVLYTHIFPTRRAKRIVQDISREHKVIVLAGNPIRASRNLKQHSLCAAHGFGKYQIANLVEWFTEEWADLSGHNVLHISNINKEEDRSKVLSFLGVEDARNK